MTKFCSESENNDPGSVSVPSPVPPRDIDLTHMIINQEETDCEQLELEFSTTTTTTATTNCDNPNENGNNRRLPSWLDGSLYSVSTGKFHFNNGFTVEHMTDGFCIMTRIRIDPKEGKVILQKKYEQSDALKKSEKAGKPVLPEYFTRSSTDVTKSRLGRWMSMLQVENSDNGNHNLFTFNNKLFTSKGLLYFREIGEEDLSTGTKFDTLKLFGLNGLCPHPIVDHDGTFYCTGASMSTTGGKQVIIKIPQSQSPSSSEKETNNKKKDKNNSDNSTTTALKQFQIVSTLPMSRAMYITIHHSFTLTKNYIILLEQPYFLNIKKMIGYVMSAAPMSLMDCTEWSPEAVTGNKFIILDKKTGKLVKTMDIYTDKPFFFLHFINSYEQRSADGASQIIVDLNSHCNVDHFDLYRMDRITNIHQNFTSPIGNAGILQRFIIPLMSSESNDKGGFVGTAHRRRSSILSIRRNSITQILDPTELLNKIGSLKKRRNQSPSPVPLTPNISLISSQQSMKHFGASAIISSENSNNGGKNCVTTPHIVLSPGSISTHGIHFGTINPNYEFKPYRYIYGSVGICLNSPYHNSIVKFDLKKSGSQSQQQVSWRPKVEDGEVVIISSTTFVPNPNPNPNPSPKSWYGKEGEGELGGKVIDYSDDDEDDGILICPATSISTLYKPKKNYVIFINAKTMVEIARASSSKDSTIPLTMHGLFVPTPKNNL